MGEKATTDPKAPVSADQLRMRMLEEQMKEIEKADKARESERKKLAAFTDDFFKHQISEEERAMIRRLVKNAAEKGQMEALVYSFPSISAPMAVGRSTMPTPSWPETLQGKAKEMFDAFKERGQPQGYRLIPSTGD